MRTGAGLLCSLLLVFGCTNVPRIEDLTGYDTYAVIHKVSCEAQQAVRYYANREGFPELRTRLGGDSNELEGLEKVKDYKEALATFNQRERDTAILNDAIDRATRRSEYTKRRITSLDLELEKELAKVPPSQQKLIKLREELKQVEAIRDGLKRENNILEEEREIIKKDTETFNKRVDRKRILELQGNIKTTYGKLIVFDNTTMAMQFMFEITEDNGNAVEGSVAWPLSIGTLTLGYNAGDTRKRLSRRTVKAGTTLKEVFDLKDCGPRDLVASRRAKRYPITGNIGMADLVWQYLLLNDKSKLSAKEGFNDKLQFTTTIKGGINPVVNLSTASKIGIKADVDASGERKDFHEVIVDIAPAGTKDDAKSPSTSKVSIESVPDVNVKLVPRSEDPDAWYPKHLQ